jgi:N6-L-threonylcarbamoyladenine synthase
MSPLLQALLRETKHTLADVDAFAVTNRPGLVGSLLVGVTAAKTLAWSLHKPLIAVHHLSGHIHSIFLNQPEIAQGLAYPHLCAVISGGHTNLYVFKDSASRQLPLDQTCVGKSRDDAAGEAFDKAAKCLGLDYPGGALIEKYAQTGDPMRFKLPKALLGPDSLDFSFSGLKTAAMLLIQAQRRANTFEENFTHLCASIQEAILETLLEKIKRAANMHGCESIALVGGVAANQMLRKKLQTLNLQTVFPHLAFCTDNAAMIAMAAFQTPELSGSQLLALTAQAQAP